MIHNEGRFNGVRNTGIYFQSWLPDDDIKAVLLIVHGLGEHSGRYINVADHFVPLGYAVYGCDHIGHGRSEGRREAVHRFTDFIDTLIVFKALISGLHQQKPVFLLGHSMGGLIAIYYLISHQADFKGAVISAPLVKVSAGISMGTILMGRLLSMIVPRVGVVQLDADGVSRDPEVVKAYQDDPLVYHGKIPARLGAEMLKAMMYVATNAHQIILPLLLVQGSEDKLVDPGGAQMIFDKVGSRDKTLHFYEGLYHELFNEPERARVLGDVATWLERF